MAAGNLNPWLLDDERRSNKSPRPAVVAWTAHRGPRQKVRSVPAVSAKSDSSVNSSGQELITADVYVVHGDKNIELFPVIDILRSQA